MMCYNGNECNMTTEKVSCGGWSIFEELAGHRVGHNGNGMDPSKLWNSFQKKLSFREMEYRFYLVFNDEE
jgi:hypothetical protein